MKNFSPLFPLAALLCSAVLSSCAGRTEVRLSVPDLPNSKIAVKMLDVNVLKTIDTLKTDASGNSCLKLDVKEGQPKFVYFYKGDVKIASVLASRGEKIGVQTDSIGGFSVAGSPESDRLREVETAYGRFLLEMGAAGSNVERTGIYVAYYRDRVKYVLSNSKSLTAIPVLYQQLPNGVPVLSQTTDAIHFRAVCDSLKTVFPESEYVKALDREAERRCNAMVLAGRLSTVEPSSFPEIEMPDMNGRKVALSKVGTKAVLVHFWDCSDPSQAMMNLEVLSPLYKKFAARGLQIYSVCVTPDKAAWGAMVTAQKLAWINVNDGAGAVVAARNWNIASLPATILIGNGEIRPNVSGEVSLEKELEKILK